MFGGIALARSIDRDNRQRFDASVDLFRSVVADQVGGYGTIGALLPLVLGSENAMMTVDDLGSYFAGVGGGISAMNALPLQGLAGVGFVTVDPPAAPRPLMLPNGAGLSNDTLLSDEVVAATNEALSTQRAWMSAPHQIAGATRYVYAVPAGSELVVLEFVDVTDLLSGAGFRNDSRLVDALAMDVVTGAEVGRTETVDENELPYDSFEVSVLGRGLVISVYPGDGFDWSPGWIPGFWFVILWLAIAVLVFVVGVANRRRSAEQEERLRLAGRIIADKDRFIAAVSHELRTPLTAVVGLADELKTSLRTFSEEELEELTSIVAQESHEMSLLVEDLLVAARIENGNVSVDPEDIDVDDEIATVQAGLGAIGADLVVTTSGASAWADPLRFRQIVRNLAINAVRHGGPSIHIDSLSSGGRTYIQVRDNGDPVSDEARERMFEPYYRSAVVNGQAPSVGLGLSVSQRLAQLMRADLTYRHEDGWSVFRLDLPTSSSQTSIVTDGAS